MVDLSLVVSHALHGWCPSCLHALFVVDTRSLSPSRVRVRVAALQHRGPLSSMRAIAMTTTTTQRKRRSRHRRRSTRVRPGLPRCNTRANQQRGREEDLPGWPATSSRISSRARLRAPRFHRPGSHGRRRFRTRMVFTVVLVRRLLITPRLRGVRASVARCRSPAGWG